ASEWIQNILHPSDFSEGSEVAFAHALKIALASRAQLNVLHVAAGAENQRTHAPSVRHMLERWGVLPPGSPRSAVPALGIQVRKVLTQQGDPVAAALAYLEQNRTDLVVLTTRRHDGRARRWTRSVAAPLTRGAGQLTLFIPAGLEGFVSAGT